MRYTLQYFTRKNYLSGKITLVAPLLLSSHRLSRVKLILRYILKYILRYIAKLAKNKTSVNIINRQARDCNSPSPSLHAQAVQVRSTSSTHLAHCAPPPPHSCRRPMEKTRTCPKYQTWPAEVPDPSVTYPGNVNNLTIYPDIPL